MSISSCNSKNSNIFCLTRFNGLPKPKIRLPGRWLFLAIICPMECRVLRLNVTECTALVQTSSRWCGCLSTMGMQTAVFHPSKSQSSTWRSSVLCQSSCLPLVIAFLMFAFGISLVFACLLNTEGIRSNMLCEACLML